MLVCKKSIFSQADTMPAYENESGKTKKTLMDKPTEPIHRPVEPIHV